jgi:hypothetical protein
LLILATPALIRAAIVFNREATRPEPANQAKAEPPPAPSFLRTLLSSVGVLAVVGFVSALAFWAAFVVACFPALAVGAGLNSQAAFVIIAGGAGFIAALGVAVWLFRKYWSRNI